MDFLQRHRVDVYNANQLDRYEQLFDLQLTSVVFGLGMQQSVQFLLWFTVQDLCIFRCTCFAIAVDLHDTLGDAFRDNVVLFQKPETNNVPGQVDQTVNGEELPTRIELSG